MEGRKKGRMVAGKKDRWKEEGRRKDGRKEG
jgi:hypothetical protein